MTKLELRILQLISRNGGQMSHSSISQQTSRHKAEDRKTTLYQLEQLGLLSSAILPNKGGKPGGRKGGGGLTYWLTDAGLAWVRDARARGEIRDKAGT